MKTALKAAKAFEKLNLSPVMAETLIVMYLNQTAGLDKLAIRLGEKGSPLRRTTLVNRLAKLGDGGKGVRGLGLIKLATGADVAKGRASGSGHILTPAGTRAIKALGKL